MDLIDRIRNDIQDRLDALLSEAEKLRKALQALDPRGGSGPTPARRANGATSSATRKTSSARRSSSSAQRSTSQKRSASAGGGRSRPRSRRTPPGATKRRVLDALSDGTPKTAGEVSAATGITRGTVSTTLSKLAKSGEVEKADRGYRLPSRQSAG